MITPTLQASPTIQHAIAQLEALGFRAGVHFDRSTALQLLHDLEAARDMWQRLGPSPLDTRKQSE